MNFLLQVIFRESTKPFVGNIVSKTNRLLETTCFKLTLIVHCLCSTTVVPIEFSPKNDELKLQRGLPVNIDRTNCTTTRL